MTLLVVVICLVVYARQDANKDELNDYVDAFCEERHPVMFRMALERITGSTDAEACVDVMIEMHVAADPAATLQDLLRDSRPLAGLSTDASNAVLAEAVDHEFGRYDSGAPAYLTAELWYSPSSWSPWRMLTSSFSHSSWDHVIGNVVFFFAFAASVELIVGWPAFIALIIGSSIFIGIADSLMSLSLGSNVPTHGLSGVVMTMIALMAFLLPAARMRCLLWWLPFFKRLALPVWLVAACYVSLDVWQLLSAADTDGVDVLAHVAGAAFGYLAGAFCLQRQRAKIGFV